jgi:hypothetical protein
MAGSFTPRSLALPTVRDVQDPATASVIQQLAQAVQNSYRSATQFQANLGISQVQFGSFTFGGLTEVVAFPVSFADANYGLFFSLGLAITSIVKTAAGFTVTISGGAPVIPVEWLAVR